MRHILLFGSSVNPPTGARGHQGLVRWAARRKAYPELDGGPLDELWVVPVYRHVYDEKSGLAPFEDRLAMSRLAFEQLEVPIKIHVSDAERTLATQWRGEGRPGTLDLIEHLEGLHADCAFGLLLGADTARDLLAGRWQRSAEIVQRGGIVVVPRQGEAFDGRGQLQLANDAPELGRVSSTEARAASGPALRRLVPESVAEYIETHALYL